MEIHEEVWRDRVEIMEWCERMMNGGHSNRSQVSSCVAGKDKGRQDDERWQETGDNAVKGGNSTQGRDEGVKHGCGSSLWGCWNKIKKKNNAAFKTLHLYEPRLDREVVSWRGGSTSHNIFPVIIREGTFPWISKARLAQLKMEVEWYWSHFHIINTTEGLRYRRLVVTLVEFMMQPVEIMIHNYVTSWHLKPIRTLFWVLEPLSRLTLCM